MGITPKRKPLPLAVGGSVHEGLAELLRRAQDRFSKFGEKMFTTNDGEWKQQMEDAAVVVALADFGQFASALQVDLAEQTGLEGGVKTLEAQLMQSLGRNTTDADIEKLALIREKSLNLFDQYLFEEQSALVEGLVRAYARRRLRPLLEQYEVLEVEREGEWRLSSWLSQERARQLDIVQSASDLEPDHELWFMSRPDALLLERQSRQLYLLSFKTAASWDIRKDRDATRDMQGLSEGVEVEKRLAGWWQKLKDYLGGEEEIPAQYRPTTKAMRDFLVSCSAPPRILGIRYEYMLKGDRLIDRDLTQEMGLDVRTQRSMLTRAYCNPGMTAGDEQWNASWEYLKEGGELSKLYWKSWRGTPTFKHMTTKQWVDMLDASAETIGEENRSLGWSSKAQSTGFLRRHPLDEIFIPLIVVYRNEDELRDWIEQVEAQEREVAERVEQVRGAKDAAEKRHLLNIYFPQTRRACEYPTTCPFASTPTAPGPCFGSDMAFEDPLNNTDRYARREPNHPVELSGDEWVGVKK